MTHEKVPRRNFKKAYALCLLASMRHKGVARKFSLDVEHRSSEFDPEENLGFYDAIAKPADGDGIPGLDIKGSYVRDVIWFLAFMRRKRKKRRAQHAEG